MEKVGIAEGVVFSEGFFKSLSVTYLRSAEDTIMKYEADAAINGLEFMENPMGTPLIPNWNRVTSAIPGILDMLKKAVDMDNK